jgi:GNAT superfamily N-acetyltransferase
VKLEEVTADAAEQWAAASRDDINAAVAAGAPRAEFRAEREVLGEFGLVRRWNLRPLAVVDGDVVGMLIVGVNKRADPDWGRYVNVFVVHTGVRYRNRGYARAAYEHVADWARAEACSRLVTTAGSVGGWRTQRSLGWPAWGLNSRREIVTDADLTGNAPEGVPPRAAKLPHGTGRPMTRREHALALTDPDGPYAVSPALLPADYQEEL